MMGSNGTPVLTRAMIERLQRQHSEQEVSAKSRVVAAESFEQRRLSDRFDNRKFIGQYSRSRLATSSYVRQPGLEIGRPIDQKLNDTPSRDSCHNRPSSGFHESPGQRFDPYR